MRLGRRLDGTRRPRGRSARSRGARLPGRGPRRSPVAHVSLDRRRDERPAEPYGRPPAARSLRMGGPPRTSGSSIRRRSGCPSKITPKKSNTSRSSQSAVGYMSVTEGTCGVSASAARPSRGAGGGAPSNTGGRPPRTAGRRPGQSVHGRRPRARSNGGAARPEPAPASASRSSGATITVTSPRAGTTSAEPRPEHPRDLVRPHRRIRASRWTFSCSFSIAVHEHLGPRRAPGHVHVHRHDRVHARDESVVVEHAPRRGAHAHRDDPLGLGHLVVDLAQHRPHLLRDPARDDHQVGLPRRRAEHLHPPPRQVVVGRRRRPSSRSRSRPVRTWPATSSSSGPRHGLAHRGQQEPALDLVLDRPDRPAGVDAGDDSAGIRSGPSRGHRDRHRLPELLGLGPVQVLPLQAALAQT